ncbi:MAG: lytic transglycosylase domain-containing protein, partial [Candidatus Competibacteraceae bacterium]|nr:lytic transglycosylase domain-containing protein [Candidatus Competibacteraceae bacterium]
MRLQLRGFSIILTTLILAACANQQPTPSLIRTPIMTNDATFPAPPGLQPQIAFWQNVYAVWGRNQVALHDDRHMDLIYTVLTLPGPVGQSYSTEQKAFLRDHYQNLKGLLQQVESKTAVNAPLTPAEQRLANFIKASRSGPVALSGASERLRSQRGLRERFKRGLEISGRYDAAFREVFREAGLPEDLAYLPHVESSFQNHAASSVGATGMWQFMPSTARQFMRLNTAVDERRDPVISAQGAARYLGNAHDRLENWPLAITSYNHGVGGMARAKREVGDNIDAIVQNYQGRSFGFASRNFYTEFLAAREIARNPQRFFPEGIAYESPLNLDRIRLRQAVDAPTLASYYEVNLDELIALNKAWKAPVHRGGKPLPTGSLVWLPAGTMIRLAQRGAAAKTLVLAEPVSTVR